MSKLVDNVPDFLYKPAAIDINKLPAIRKEGFNLFKFLNNGFWKNNQEKKFYLVTDFNNVVGKIDNFCPTLAGELTRLKLQDFFYGILFVQKLSTHTEMPIHRDAEIGEPNVHGHYGLNFPIIGCENTYTVFYDASYGQDNRNADESTFGTDGVKRGGRFVDPDTAVEIGRVNSNMPIWVNTHAFHTGITLTNKPRLLMSLRFYELNHYFENGYFDEHLVAKSATL
jgi:hypothetical protein